ncbi:MULTISPECIES: hypothetical protein [Mycobacteroides]|jgi:hypothetical protein|uniref:Uncharacterized protein n=2 Tax=Mycobacteroides chelonae TaxID=1774 RepID=A0AB73LH71_MYCCH|nr:MULTISPECIES: hypothetical protein [Mycobacteroides]KRQ27821.1 hypothetical protein AOT86_11055 [Mycobacteroides sp. H072]KRQ41776.1 hypothetical protein AOT84_01170 [Mycobacteroides sp. H002]KRQ53904.1 hypothetical protein AOT85_05980 [Mycobacteroides sp. H054]KRQ71842.1 hypothetical protein AOT83_06260 [Mycobacteroides sp. H001]MBF9318656.1 hypothetical protein [Mycobacteroides chelonae]
MRTGFLLMLAVITSVLMGACSSEKAESGPGERNEVVATALARVEADLGKPVKLDVKTFKSADDWALVDGQLQDTGGSAPSRYEGLLRKTGPKWTILESVIGSTDAQWVGWKAKYPEAPAQIWP